MYAIFHHTTNVGCNFVKLQFFLAWMESRRISYHLIKWTQIPLVLNLMSLFLSCVVSSTVCIVAASVKVAPKVEVLKGETAKLPCTYTDPSSITLVEWYIVSNFPSFKFSSKFEHQQTGVKRELGDVQIKKNGRHFQNKCLSLITLWLSCLFFHESINPQSFSYSDLTGGPGIQEARGFPLSGWQGRKWRGHPSDWPRHYWGRLHLDHLFHPTHRWARLLLPGHSWPRRDRRCHHFA